MLGTIPRRLSPFVKPPKQHLFAKSFRPLQQYNRFSTSSRILAVAMTENYKFNHTMIRVKDPQRSIKFYELLGMKLINEMHNEGFSLYFLGYDSPNSPSHGKHWSEREGLVELTWNHGTEKKDGQVYHNGNSEPRGFGHLAVSVDNIQAACKKFEDAGYTFQKKLTDGRMRSIAFLKDPDDYWVEIISFNPVDKTESITTTDTSTYLMNHTMLRVKDIEKSLKFYQEVLGMTLQRVSEQKEAGFSLYFLSYGPQAPKSSPNGVNPVADREGLLELTWNYGTEKEEGQIYHNGNNEPQGFGHICISVPDIKAACQRFEEKGVQFKKRLQDGKMHNIAFILDDDQYWIEIVEMGFGS